MRFANQNSIERVDTRLPQLPRAAAEERLVGAPPAWETRLSRVFQEYQDHEVANIGLRPDYLVVAAAALSRIPALTSLFRLAVLDLHLGRSGEGPAIRRRLRRTTRLGRLFFLRSIVDVLPIPVDSDEYIVGASRQTLRRKLRAAEKAGITWRVETSPEARAYLVKSFVESERSHPIARYRSDAPELADLVDYGLWLVAESRDGDPIFAAVIPIAGTCGLLRYFRTIGNGEHQSLARYLMSKVLVDELSRRGVRYLINSNAPWDLPSGLRHFQRMTGWRLARVRVTS